MEELRENLANSESELSMMREQYQRAESMARTYAEKADRSRKENARLEEKVILFLCIKLSDKLLTVICGQVRHLERSEEKLLEEVKALHEKLYASHEGT